MKERNMISKKSIIFSAIGEDLLKSDGEPGVDRCSYAVRLNLK